MDKIPKVVQDLIMQTTSTTAAMSLPLLERYASQKYGIKCYKPFDIVKTKTLKISIMVSLITGHSFNSTEIFAHTLMLYHGFPIDVFVMEHSSKGVRLRTLIDGTQDLLILDSEVVVTGMKISEYCTTAGTKIIERMVEIDDYIKRKNRSNGSQHDRRKGV